MECCPRKSAQTGLVRENTSWGTKMRSCPRQLVQLPQSLTNCSCYKAADEARGRRDAIQQLSSGEMSYGGCMLSRARLFSSKTYNDRSQGRRRLQLGRQGIRAMPQLPRQTLDKIPPHRLEKASPMFLPPLNPFSSRSALCVSHAGAKKCYKFPCCFSCAGR